MMFSARLPPYSEPNRLTLTLAALRERGDVIIDLTESNPTKAGLPYPADLLAPLADARALRYDPHPLGLASARAAVAADQARRGVTIDPAHVVLTASTSEAYTWVFKLLCDPGASVLVPRPSYPLFEHLTRLEGVRAEPYDLDYHGRWEIDFASLAHAAADARAILVVSPNNPTGSYVSAHDFERLQAFCRDRGCALVADEVFVDYPLDAASATTDLAVHAEVLAFTLGGLSKSCGLPQLKLGWIVVGGPATARGSALAAIELIADSFLSVGTPVQIAAPELLARATPVREAIHARIRRNLDCARRAARQVPACEVLRAEGGWCAVVRIPATRTEEQFVLHLLETERILVHPGYFFDFCAEAFIVVSLLPAEDLFARAFPRVLHAAVS
jgi:aspartate/methionine/tyrosine aminotransferase